MPSGESERVCVREGKSERERERKKLQLWLWRSRGLISKRGKMSLLRWFPFISSRPEWTMVSYVPVTFRHRQTHALHHAHSHTLHLSLSLTHTHTLTNKHTLSVLTHRKEKWGHIDLTDGQNDVGVIPVGGSKHFIWFKLCESVCVHVYVCEREREELGWTNKQDSDIFITSLSGIYRR